MKILIATCQSTQFQQHDVLSDDQIVNAYVLKQQSGGKDVLDVDGYAVDIYSLNEFIGGFNHGDLSLSPDTDYIRYVAYTEVQTIKREVVKLEDQ